MTDLPPSDRDTSMMFQSFALFPHRTVAQNVEFSLKMQEVAKEQRDREVGEMLEKVDLSVLADRYRAISAAVSSSAWRSRAR